MNNNARERIYFLIFGEKYVNKITFEFRMALIEKAMEVYNPNNEHYISSCVSGIKWFMKNGIMP